MELFGVDLDQLVPPDEITRGGKSKNIQSIDFTTEALEEKSSKINVDYRVIDILSDGCLHQCVLPHDFKFTPLKPLSSEPARKYNFTLDYFQRQSILCIENQQSVLVSAHTSAGKTVVAEYAIAMCLAKKQRVVYTTPIKALSNQKYRDFLEVFKDVGLMTGDVTINPSASVIIMTTEILRAMLYRGSDLTREIGWVIFDEIHYMREKSRGVVWEETLILLPDQIKMVFLSATIPNAAQFAQWIVSLHSSPCHVVYTDYRPTPLQHYVFPCGGDGIFLVVNQQREFITENFNKAMQVISDAGDNAKNDSENRGRGGGSQRVASYCLQLIKLAIDRELDPLIVFSFSKRMCQTYADQLQKLELTKKNEKEAVELIYNSAISSLSDDDKKLPQVRYMLPMVKRGIGVHHGGLLPIIKEIVEILFSEGYIKVLFATETFAMGLNMPARCVLFTGTSKFDGKSSRLISPGEYIQMSGRAGRRGKDKLGTVILMADNKLPPSSAKDLLCGNADPLNSAFQLTNTMILNLLRVEGLNPDYMLEKSFLQFQNYQALPKYQDEFERIRKEIASIPAPECFNVEKDQENLNNYVKILNSIKRLSNDQWMHVPRIKMFKYFQTGRVVKIERDNFESFGHAIIISFNSSCKILHCLMKVDLATPEPVSFAKKRKSMHNNSQQQEDFESGFYNFDYISPVHDAQSESWKSALVTVPIKAIVGISSVCLRITQMIEEGVENIKSPGKKRKKESKSGSEQILRKMANLDEDTKRHIYLSIERAKSKLPDNHLPYVDLVKDMKVTEASVLKAEEKITKFRECLEKNPLHSNPGLKDILDYYKRCSFKYSMLSNAQEKLRECESVIQLDELIARKRLLRRLGFSGQDDSVALKGRIACELSNGDELLLTELLLDGVFSDLSPVQCAAVLSVFVNEGADNDTIANQYPPRADLQKILDLIKDKAKYIAAISTECRMAAGAIRDTEAVDDKHKNRGPRSNNFYDRIVLESEELDYVRKFDGSLMEVVREWAQGKPFITINQMTSQMEGSLVRIFRRLEELLRQMHDAAKVAGDSQLEEKFVRAMILIRRDIVFANSLYLV